MKDAMIGSHVNRYEIRESLHRSDLIGIYKAYDTKLERLVFLKTILHSADYSQEAVDFFIAESRSLAKLAHPNIAKVLDFGYENENLYLISEYVTGKPLSELMDVPMPWQKAVNILLPLMDALIYAHSKDVIHRDLKPENITINSDGQPTLSDFSLIRIIEEEETRDMTGTNVGLGSAAYISPEQGKGLTADFRSDIYSLGVIFFEMITGKKLFYAANSMEIVLQHIIANPPKPRSIIPDLPKSIEDVILNALSKDREKRYQTMEAFSDALKAIVDESNKAKSKPKPLIGIRNASVAGLVLIVAIVLAWRSAQSTATIPTTQEPVSTPTLTVSTATKIAPTVTKIKITPTPPPETDYLTIYKLPSIPVLPGNELPASAVIDANNAENIVELARWGIPMVNQFVFINEDKALLAATSAGIFYFDPKDLSVRHFFDTGEGTTSLSVSDDGEWAATGNEKGTLSVWNIIDGKLNFEFNINETEEFQPRGDAEIVSIDIASDKSKLVFSDTKNNIHLWNLKQSQPYPFEQKHGDLINKVIFSPDGNTVISGSEDFQIRTWDTARGVALQNYPASQKIIDMAISPDNKRLAIGLNIGKIEIWNIEDIQKAENERKNIENTPLQLEIQVTHIAFLPDNQTIVAGSEDGVIRIWNIDTGEKLWETPSRDDDTIPPAIITTLSVSSNGAKFVVMFKNGLIEIWDIGKRELETSRYFKHEEIKRIAISPNDETIAVQNGDPIKGKSFVQILSLTDSSQSAKINGALPRGNPISPNSQTVIVKSKELELELYSLSATNPQKLFTLYNFPLNGTVSYLPDNSIIFAAASADDMVYWSTSSGMQLAADLQQKIRNGICMGFYYRNGSLLAAGSFNGIIYSDQNIDKFCKITHRPASNSEEFLPDGSIIALSAQNSQIIDVWNLQNGNEKSPISSNTLEYVLDVAISNDGKLLASVSKDGLLEIFNLESREMLKTLKLHTGSINQVLFSNNGKYIILGSADGTLRFFGLYP